MPLPAPGDLFEREYTVGGVRIGLLAEVEISEGEIHLKDIAIYPLGAQSAPVGVVAIRRILRNELMAELRREGFSVLRITGQRLSGGHRGHIVDLRIRIPESP